MPKTMKLDLLKDMHEEVAAAQATRLAEQQHIDEEDGKPVHKHGVLSAHEPSCSNLIINYLPHEIGQKQLRRLFEAHGTISHVKVVTD